MNDLKILQFYDYKIFIFYYGIMIAPPESAMNKTYLYRYLHFM